MMGVGITWMIEGSQGIRFLGAGGVDGSATIAKRDAIEMGVRDDDGNGGQQ